MMIVEQIPPHLYWIAMALFISGIALIVVHQHMEE